MKEKILKILLETTDTEWRYVGGGDEPSIITFKNSENRERESWLSKISDKIVIELQKKENANDVVKELNMGRHLTKIWRENESNKNHPAHYHNLESYLKYCYKEYYVNPSIMLNLHFDKFSKWIANPITLK